MQPEGTQPQGTEGTQPEGTQPQEGQTQAQLQMTTIAPYGQILTDANGHPVYMFAKDKKGQASTCTGQCARVWPPVTVAQGMQAQLGPSLDQSKLTTIKRKDGATQLAYNGYPLYTYDKDQAPGEVHGQDIRDFGATWYLVSPQGMPIKKK
jgi:predicted lipoprotein with Yx(FWY)xxD motif